jgi:hypothetical protein
VCHSEAKVLVKDGLRGLGGVRKWLADGVRCQSYWGRNGVTCAVCMTACPWSKPDNWVHRLARPFAAKGGQAAARVLVSMERVFYGKYTKAPDPSWAK